MARLKRPTTILKAFVSQSLIFAFSAGALHAADLANPVAAPPSPVPEAPARWYVKLGALGALNQSWSSLFAQPVAAVVVPGIGLVPVGGFGPQVSLVGRGATYSSIFSASFQAGYFFTPNWSLEVSTAVPLWLTIKITGFSATPPFSGAVLGKLLPGVVPITAVYHFTQCGAIQPYLGAELFRVSNLRFRTGLTPEARSRPPLASLLRPALIICSTQIGASFSTLRDSSYGQQGSRPDSISVRRSGRFPGPPQSRQVSSRGCSQPASRTAFEPVQADQPFGRWRLDGQRAGALEPPALRGAGRATMFQPRAESPRGPEP
jgi:hypothetical protein